MCDAIPQWNVDPFWLKTDPYLGYHIPIMASQPFAQRSLEAYKIKSCGKKSTYLLSLDILRDMNAKRWSRQRPADDSRVEEIHTWITKEKDVSGVLSMAWHPREDLVIYDGQHRWAALLSIRDDSIRVLVEIIWDATEQDIIESFQSINRSVSVPELYTDPALTDEQTHREITEFVTTLAKTYADFCSRTDKPHRPNFNRDRLTDELLSIWKDHYQKELPFEIIQRGIITLNMDYHTDEKSVPREVVRKTARMYEKCNKSRFWLFAQYGHINKDHLDTIVRRHIRS